MKGVAVKENNLTEVEKNLKPDILNGDLNHLFEIKPKGSENLGLFQAQSYQAIFQKAGVPISLGSIAEPGTMGLVEAPAGWYVFWCEIPGVIVYQRIPQPKPELAEKPVPAKREEPWTDSEFMKKMATITGLTGTALVIYVIVSEGSRAFPPRNAIPIP